MARFRMKPKQRIIGGDLDENDIIFVEAQNATQITTQMVRDALKSQLGKNMRCLYSEHEWDIVKI